MYLASRLFPLFLFVFPLLAQLETVIVAPQNDQNVDLGAVLVFEAVAEGAEGEPFFVWEISSGASSQPEIIEERTFEYQFEEPGTYVFRCTAQTDAGQIDTTPAERVIRVREDGGGGGDALPDTEILIPTADLVLNLGDSFTFRAEGTSNASGFLWDFTLEGTSFGSEEDGQIVSYVFDRAGTWVVTCAAYNDNGFDETPAMRRVVVEETGGGDVDTVILSPSNGEIFNRGDQIRLSADAPGVDGSAVSFNWKVQDPDDETIELEGNNLFITLDLAGNYEIQCTAVVNGVADDTPAQIAVQALGDSGGDEPNTTIVSPSSGQDFEPGESISFEAIITDADPSQASYAWTIIFPNGERETFDERSFDASFSQEGSYTAECAATLDGVSDSTPASVRFDVEARGGGGGDAPDTIILSPLPEIGYEVGEDILFEATVDSSQSGEARYLWTVIGPDGTREEGEGQSFEASFDQPGLYTAECAAEVDGVRDPTPAVVRFTVEDGGGGGGGGSGDGVDTEIILPPQDRITVDEGETVSFVADYVLGKRAANYFWTRTYPDGTQDTFDQPNLTLTFFELGEHIITCAAEVDGVRDPTPAQVIVEVEQDGPGGGSGGGGGSGTNPPDTIIEEPFEDEIFIDPGAQVDFVGVPVTRNASQAQIFWQVFRGEDEDEAPVGQGEGRDFSYVFPEEGVYLVLCIAVLNGVADPDPAYRFVIVNSLAAPDTQIVSPTTDLTITAGETVDFLADSASDNAFFFIWTVTLEGTDEGFELESEDLSISFDFPGVYIVSCAAWNNQGPDPTPDVRTITVTGDTSVVDTVIRQPTGDPVRINVGESLFFEAELINASGSEQVAWNLIELDSDLEVQTLVDNNFEYRFNEVGFFLVRAFAVLDGVQLDDEPAELLVEVVPEGGDAFIVAPEELVLQALAGSELKFTGETVGVDVADGLWFIETEDSDLTLVGEGADFCYTFDASGEYLVLFGIPGADGDTGEGFDFRFVTIFEDTDHGIQITAPSDFAEVAVNSRVDLSATLLGATESETEVTWILGDEVLTGLNQPNIRFNRPGEYVIEVVSDSPTKGFAFDAVLIDVYDPKASLQAEIIEPETNLTIQPGETVFFEGRARGRRGPEVTNPRWWVRDADGNELVSSEELGTYTFDTPGTYTVAYRVDTRNRQSPEVTRTIRVTTSEGLGISDNFTLETAFPLEPGSYSGISLEQEEYYKFSVANPDRTLVFELSGDGEADIELLATDGKVLNTTKITAADNLRGSFLVQDLDAGDYILHVIPSDTSGKTGLSFNFGVQVLAPSLYFPDIQVSAQYTTDIGIVNPNGEAATVEMVGYNAAGAILETSTRDIPAKGKLAGPVSTLFTNAADINWISVNSTLTVKGYAHTRNNSGNESFATTAANKLAGTLYVPHVAVNTGTWYTRASVVNGSAEQTVSSITSTGLEPVALTNTKSFSADNFNFQQRYGGTIPDSLNWSRMEESTAGAALAGNEVFGTVDGTNQAAGLTLSNPEKINPNFTYIRNNLYFTHIARDTSSFWTGITLVNINDTANGVLMRAYGDGGVEVGSKVINLEAGGKMVTTATALLEGIGSPANVSWIAVESDAPIVGYELFGTLNRERLALAGFEASDALKKELVFPYLAPCTDWHGVSVINVNSEQATLSFTLYTDAGTALKTAEITLAANEKRSTTLESLFGVQTLPVNASWVICDADRPIAGFMIFGDTATGQQMAALIAE